MTIKFDSTLSLLFSSNRSSITSSIRSKTSRKLLLSFCSLGLLASVPAFAADLQLRQEFFVDSVRGIAVTDVDADGDFDIVATSFKEGHGAVYIRDEIGMFHRANTGNTLPAAVEIAAGDINGDGKVDIVIDPESGADQVLLGDGLGGFHFDANYLFNYSFNFETRAIEIADFNGDGRNDIAFANLDGANAIWLSDSNGDLNLQTFGNSASYSIKSGDLDNDGDVDLVVGNIRNASFTNGANNVWLNDGAGNFTLSSSFNGSRTIDIQLADLDKDGDLDILATNDYYGTEVGNLSAWINNGLASYSTNANMLISGPSMFSSSVADVDQDGDMDIYVSCIGSYKNRLLLNNGSGSYSTKYLHIMDDVNSQHAVFANVSGDGYPDLVLTESVGKIRIAVNQPQAPLITGSVVEHGVELEPFSYIPTKADAQQVLAFSATNVPVWASFNTETGEISGTPSIGDAGTYSNIVISATDGTRTTILLPLTIHISANQEVPDADLIAHYPMRGNLDDIKNGHHGYSYGVTPVKGQKGQPVEAFSFDGIDDHQVIKSGGALAISSGSWNIWVKTEMEDDIGIVVESNQTTEVKNNTVYGFGVGLVAASGTYTNSWCDRADGVDYYMFSVHSVAGNHQFACSPNGSMRHGQWQMVTLTVDGLVTKIYVDGNLVTTATVAEQIRFADNYWFGMRPLDPRHPKSHPFKGDIAEFMVFRNALTDAEVQQLYLATK